MATDNCKHVWLVPVCDPYNIIFSITGEYCEHCELKRYYDGPMYDWEDKPR